MDKHKAMYTLKDDPTYLIIGVRGDKVPEWAKGMDLEVLCVTD